MRNRTLLLVSTVLLAVLYIGATVALGRTPDADDGGPAVVSWFVNNGGHVRWWLWLSTLSFIALAVFASLIRRQLPAPHRDIFFFGAIALAVEGAVQGWLLAGMSWHADLLDPATARTLFDVSSYWGPVLTSATILMLAPVTVLAWRGQAGLPRWLAVVTGVAVIEQLIETVTIFGESSLLAPGGPMNVILGAGLVAIALACLGIATARSMTD